MLVFFVIGIDIEIGKIIIVVGLFYVVWSVGLSIVVVKLVVFGCEFMV